ncbi:MAG: 2-dehydro-3-deoxygluconokinase [Candidatus Atribacteria bacterium]|nr:2-dehydro-3-deoxygluconokinase [Candidatus Atribacteria bacterium]
MKVDVLSYGEPLIRLTPERFKTFLKSNSWEVEIGGAEANVLAGCSILGLETQLLGALPDNFLGRRVVQELRRFGIGVDRLELTEEGRMGLYFLEFAHRREGAEVLYDRKDSTFSCFELKEEDFSLLSQSSLLHLTGITPPLSPICDMNVRNLLRLKPVTLQVSFDVNYRSKLWSPEICRKFMEEVMEFIDILFIKEEDLQIIWGLENEDCWEKLTFLHSRYGEDKIYVLTAGEKGCFVLDRDISLHQPSFTTEAVDRIGAGDAFVAGFLYGYLGKKSLEEAALWGNAMASLKMSVVGDMPIFDRHFAEALVTSSMSRKVNR